MSGGSALQWLADSQERMPCPRVGVLGSYERVFLGPTAAEGGEGSGQRGRAQPGLLPGGTGAWPCWGRGIPLQSLRDPGRGSFLLLRFSRRAGI